METEFVSAVDRFFGFLRARYGCAKQIETDAEGVTVRFQNQWVAVELRLEEDRRIFADVVPLVNGRIPPRFVDGREQLTHHPLAGVIASYEPGWDLPRGNAADDHGAIADVLGEYATALQRVGGGFLRGADDPFGAAQVRMREQLVPILVKQWADFVERVQRGFLGGIGEYSLAIASRGQLEDAIQHWQAPSRPEALAQLADLDRAFDGLTVPVDGVTVNYRVVVGSNALRWWRRPRDLVGPLKEYFAGQ